MPLEKINTRHWFVAPEGYLIGACDFSSQEIRSAAALSGDENIAKVLKLERDYELGVIQPPIDPDGNPYVDPGVDLHIVAATSLSPEVKEIFNNTPWLCNKDNPIVSKFRQRGKILNYALIYLAQAATIAQQIGCSLEEAQDSIDKYFSKPDGFWQLGAWLKAIAHLASETRWTRLPGKALLYVNEDNAKGSGDKSASQRKACNGQVQGISSIQSKIALVGVVDEFERLNKLLSPLIGERKGRVTGVIHD